jgi:hypothetical protein
MKPIRRLAMLVGSSLAIDKSMKPIPREVRDTNLGIMAEALGSLGDYKFSWTDPSSKPKILRDPTRPKFIQTLASINPPPTSDDLLLFYYFGHGFVGTGGNLTLSYKGLDISRDTDNFSLNAAASEMLACGFKKLLFIIECCHAGLASPAFTVITKHGSYFLMAATGEGRAYFDDFGGEFTRALANALTYRNSQALRDVALNSVTLETWFDVAKDLISTAQTPTCSGTLGKEILYPYQVSLSPSVNLAAPPKSLYMKLYYLLTILREVRSLSLEDIYRNIKKLKLPAFKVTYYENGQVLERFVIQERVQEYLELASSLGLATTKGTKWGLTSNGTSAVIREGAKFNQKLLDGVLQWLPSEVDDKVLNSILFQLANRAVLPKILNIERGLIERRLPTIKRKELRKAMQLLAYAGAVQRATSDTFFPR